MKSLNAKVQASNTDQVVAGLAALLLGLLHLVHHLIHLVHHLIIRRHQIHIQNLSQVKKTYLSGNLVEVLLHGDGSLGGAKEEQQEEED